MSDEKSTARTCRAESLAKLAISFTAIYLFLISVIGADPRMVAFGMLLALGPALVLVYWATSSKA